MTRFHATRPRNNYAALRTDRCPSLGKLASALSDPSAWDSPARCRAIGHSAGDSWPDYVWDLQFHNGILRRSPCSPRVSRARRD